MQAELSWTPCFKGQIWSLADTWSLEDAKRSTIFMGMHGKKTSIRTFRALDIPSYFSCVCQRLFLAAFCFLLGFYCWFLFSLDYCFLLTFRNWRFSPSKFQNIAMIFLFVCFLPLLLLCSDIFSFLFRGGSRARGGTLINSSNRTESQTKKGSRKEQKWEVSPGLLCVKCTRSTFLFWVCMLLAIYCHSVGRRHGMWRGSCSQLVFILEVLVKIWVRFF